MPFGVLISGSGTNLQALLDACAAPGFPAEIAVVVSNRADAFGLERARAAGVPAIHVPHRGRTRSAFEADLVSVLQDHGVEWVALAGFMRLLTPTFLNAFPSRVLNVHPALLPSFPGSDGAGDALAAGVRVAGVTVHVVDEGVDTGPILAQGTAPVLPDDDRARLHARLQRLEHRLFPMVMGLVAEGRLRVDGRVVHADLRAGESLSIMDATP
jgi:phosphoribosylglycinamide formyltransferase 1